MSRRGLRRWTLVCAVGAIGIAPIGCSISRSSESLSESVSSPFTSSSSSSAEEDSAYQDEVAGFTAGFARSGGDPTAFRRGIASIAQRRGIGDWEDDDPTCRAIGRGLRRAGLDRSRAAALRLVDGSRPDWGTALLVAMARLSAIESSLHDGHLRVLDAYPDAAPTLASDVLARRRDLLPQVAEATGAVARAALRSFVARRSSPAAWSDVEDAVNRHQEVLGAWREARPLRAHPERLVPARGGPFPEPAAPLASADALDRALAAAEERERRIEDEIRRVHGYHLVSHNCVSELFATLHSASGEESHAAAALGGRFDGRSRLGFIPFVAAQRVERRYRGPAGFEIPSLRRARLARRSEADGSAWLRESSPLTARAVRPGARDSFFLFFTDHVVWPRPLLGALNLAAGAGGTVAGLLALPVDGGRTLLRGVRGVLMSLPELVFVNLRKGTNDWVPRGAWRELGVDAAWVGCDGSSACPEPGGSAAVPAKGTGAT